MGNAKKILYLACSPTRSMFKAVRELKAEGIDWELKLIYDLELTEEKITREELFNDLVISDAIIMDFRGTAFGLEEIFQEALVDARKPVLGMPYARAIMPFIQLGEFSMKKFARTEKVEAEPFIDTPSSFVERIRMFQNLILKAGKYLPIVYFKDAANYVRFCKYFYAGGIENYSNMFRLILSYLGVETKPLAEPAEPKEYGIYHPDLGYFDDLEAYWSVKGFRSDKPNIGVLFFGGLHLELAEETLRALERKFAGYNFIPVYTDGFKTLEALRNYLGDKRRPVEAIISLQWFRLNGGPLGGNPQETITLLNKLNVPVFTPATMYMERIEDWKKSPIGLDPIETIASITWPELDGCIEPIPICGIHENPNDNQSCPAIVPITDRMERISDRIKKRIALRAKSNQEKRIALIIYNYPPGEANLASAAYLDVFTSIEQILKSLKTAGYLVKIPEKPLSELFLEFHLVNSGRWLNPAKIPFCGFSLELNDYLEFFHTLPASSQKQVTAFWGEPPGKIMCNAERIFIPAIELGNLLIGLQPSRPLIKKQDPSQSAHDRSVPPHHQYLAFYYWLEKKWQADAVVHIGTHGLLEFMPGKELAPAREDFPELLIGNLPHFYFYHILNTSEASIAKRRAYATLISYNSPPYSEAGLYQEYQELENLIQQYQVSAIDPARANRLREMIEEKAKAVNLSVTNIDQLHNEIYRIKRSVIPRGLHIIGKSYHQSEAKDFLKLLLRWDRGEIHSLEKIFGEGISKGELEGKVNQIIELALDKGPELAVRSVRLSRASREKILRTLRFGIEKMKNFINNQNELINLLKALNGEYLEPGPGGDVIRTPEILPSGKNIFQFDPTQVPTDLAMERGAEIAEKTLMRYRAQTGVYPESVAVVLWGFETTGTGGETIGQIFRYLGVKLNRKYGFWDPKPEPISLKELGRPRIDCLVSICGFFREMFPQQLELLAQTFQLLSELDEPEELNPIKKHSRENRELIASTPNPQKLDCRIAERLACARIFGPQSGEYGTKMLSLIEDSVWEKEEDLAKAHFDSMAYAHAKNLHAFRIEEIYLQNLKRVKLVSQIIYSNDYDLIDLDHYYEFSGGLSRSIEMETGRRPALFFSDSRWEKIETESAGVFLENAIRSRLLNPKWIDSMLNHNWHGPQKIADRVEYLIGWSATAHNVPSWIYSQIANKFVFDQNTLDRINASNPFAGHQLMERLMEAFHRGYWQASEEEIHRLENAINQNEALLEEKSI